MNISFTINRIYYILKILKISWLKVKNNLKFIQQSEDLLVFFLKSYKKFFIYFTNSLKISETIFLSAFKVANSFMIAPI